MKRTPIFILTFLTYAIVHMMRTTYSFNKHVIAQKFNIGHLFLGIVDSVIFMSLAIGTFFRYSILNDKKPTLTCLKTAFPTSISFIIIPIISLFKDEIVSQEQHIFMHVIMVIAFGLFGFFQLSFFPATLTLFSQHFNVKNDGILVGIWSSKSNVGNIFGFLLASLLVNELSIRWQITMIICSILLLIVTILQHLYVPYVEDNEEQISTSLFFKFLKQKWNQTQFKLYIISFSLFKAILYSYQFWTPKFLTDTGYKNYAGYVPMLFDVSTLFGSFIMGNLYKNQANLTEKPSTIRIFVTKYKFFIPSLLVIAASFGYIVIPGSLAVYFILGALMGLFLGAIYNSLQNNQILNYTQNDPRNTDMFSTANIAIGCTMVGIFQLLIGVVMHIGQATDDQDDDSDDSDFIKKGMVYFVIAGMGILAASVTFARSFYEKNKIQFEIDSGDKINKEPLLSQKQ